MAKPFPLNPPHPERNCWGCDRYCAKDNMLCGNGSDRTQHPIETFGPGWDTWVAPPASAQQVERAHKDPASPQQPAG
jgi:hypothetical protein